MKCQLCNKEEATIMWICYHVCDNCLKNQLERQKQHEEETKKLKDLKTKGLYS